MNGEPLLHGAVQRRWLPFWLSLLAGVTCLLVASAGLAAKGLRSGSSPAPILLASESASGSGVSSWVYLIIGVFVLGGVGLIIWAVRFATEGQSESGSIPYGGGSIGAGYDSRFPSEIASSAVRITAVTTTVAFLGMGGGAF
mmetsp:Transcript_59962/g.128696  ORF Transcript_59962/g.128696 Transcript_59962/m.128696 type:complete len:142 (-) Transcript_59962:187-612(-)